MTKTPTVYFIRNTRTSAIKVGYTDGDVRDRLKQLQTGSSDPLEILYSVRVWNRQAETALHRYLRLFDGQRIIGEWYQPEEVLRLIEFVKENDGCLCSVFSEICADIRMGGVRWQCNERSLEAR